MIASLASLLESFDESLVGLTNLNENCAGGADMLDIEDVKTRDTGSETEPSSLRCWEYREIFRDEEPELRERMYRKSGYVMAKITGGGGKRR